MAFRKMVITALSECRDGNSCYVGSRFCIVSMPGISHQTGPNTGYPQEPKQKKKEVRLPDFYSIFIKFQRVKEAWQGNVKQILSDPFSM